MAIAKRRPDVEPKVEALTPDVEEQTYLGIVHENENLQVTSMLAYIDGMPWTVQYYSQLIGMHNDLRELDSGQDAAFQQYQNIKDLEIRVDSALQTSYDSNTNLTTVSGSANVYGFVPNSNDYFIAEAGSTNTALFRITTVERKAFNRQSVYLINYTLVRYITDQDEQYINLQAKVVRTYKFSKERVVEGLSPLLRVEQNTLYTQIGSAYKHLARYYYKTFFNNDFKTLILPKQSRSIYDHGLIDFLRQIMDTLEADEITSIMYAPVDNDAYINEGGLWRVLLDRDYAALEYTAHKAVILHRSHFSKASWLRSAFYWPIEYHVIPLALKRAGLTNKPEPVLSDAVDLEPTDSTYDPLKTTVNGVRLIPYVAEDDYYVLSQWFYTNKGQSSVLEILVRDYLKCQTIDLHKLNVLVSSYRTWPILEQFYFGPLLFLLMKDAVRGFYR